MITPDQMDQVHVALGQVSTLAFEQIVMIGGTVAVSSRDQWGQEMSRAVPEVLASHRSVGVDIMAGSLDDMSDLGVSVPQMDRATLLTDARVAALVGWVAREAVDPDSAIRKLSGIGQKLVLEGPRTYTTGLSEEHGTTARRFAQPGACEWCRYIAVQEHRYEHYGSEWVRTNSADRFHEHCRCVLIPASEYIEPDYIRDWDRQVSDVRNEVGGYGRDTWRDHLAAMRRNND